MKLNLNSSLLYPPSTCPTLPFPSLFSLPFNTQSPITTEYREPLMLTKFLSDFVDDLSEQ